MDPCQVNKTDWNESVEPNDLNKWPTEQNKSEQTYFWTFTDWTKVNWTKNFVQLTFVQYSPVVWIDCGLAQISRAFGQGAKSPTPRGRCAPRACKNLLQPSHLWLGFIVVWINCGLDPLWFGSWIVTVYWVCLTPNSNNLTNVKLNNLSIEQWNCSMASCSKD